MDQDSEPQIPSFHLVYLEPDGITWSPYICRLSGTRFFSLEEGQKRAAWLLTRGFGKIVKMVDESGERAIWELGVNGKVRRTL